MRKRILAALLSISVLLSMVILPVNAADDTTLSVYENVCIGIGCIDADEYDPDKPVTRGEFAKIIADLRGLTTDSGNLAWEESVYGEENDSQTVIISKNENVFDDVDSSHPDYESIMAVYSHGYMVGVGERRFAPDFDISVMEATKVILDMVGYEGIAAIDGGHHESYEQIARQTGLLSGIASDPDVVATQKNILRLIYNSFDLQMVERVFDVDGGYQLSDETFMNSRLNLYSVRGVLTDNGMTKINGASNIGKDKIMVGDLIAVLPDSLASYRKLLGRMVELYYTIDEDYDYNQVVFITIDGSDESITINADDVESFVFSESGVGTITFYNNGRLTSKTISQSASMICNNQLVLPYGPADFIFETGDITLCKTRDDDYNLIVINKYDTFFVSSVSTVDKTIYNAINSPNNTSFIKVTEEEYPNFINITDKSGKSLSLADITKGSVLNVLRSADSVEIIVTTDRVTDFVLKSHELSESRATDDFVRRVISDGEQQYEVLKSYYDMSTSAALEFNDVYTLYLDMNGNVVWMEKGAVAGTRVGIITRIDYYSEDEPCYVRIFESTNEVKKYEIADKFFVNGTMKKKYSRTGEDAEMVLDPIRTAQEIILFNIDAEGKLSDIITPAASNSGDYKRGWNCLTDGSPLSYGQNGYDFSMKFYYVPGRTKVFTIPDVAGKTVDEANSAIGNSENYSVGNGSFNDNTTYNTADSVKIEAYAYSPDAVEAEIIVQKDIAESGGNVDTRSAFLIEDIRIGVNSENEIIHYLDGYKMELNVATSTRSTLILEPDDEIKMLRFDNDSDGHEIDPDMTYADYTGPKTVNELEPGDIIRYSANIQGEVDCIAVAYDYDQKVAYRNSAHMRKNDANIDYAQANTYAGNLMSKYGTGIKVTSYAGSPGAATEDTIKAFRVSNVPVFIVRKVDGLTKIEVRAGSIDDAAAFKDTRSICDRVALLSYYTSLVYGAVIYK